MLHGIWEDHRNDKTWGLYGGKDFLALWWRQERDGTYGKESLPTDLVEVADQRRTLEILSLLFSD